MKLINELERSAVALEQEIATLKSVAGKLRDEAIQSDMVSLQDVRQAVADYMYAEGCSCCRDIEGHERAGNRLGELLDVEQYSDGSGYDFTKYRSE